MVEHLSNILRKVCVYTCVEHVVNLRPTRVACNPVSKITATTTIKRQAGEMAQWLRALIGPEFNSQQPHGGSQSSVMGSDALFWCV